MKKSCVKLVAISMAVGLFGFNVPSNMYAQEVTNTIISKTGYGIALANEDEGSDTEQVRYGDWVLVNGRYKFQFEEGDFAVNERLEINGKTYAFDKYGYMITTDWFQEDEYWYYFDNNGAMHYGWLQLDSKWYYFDLEYGYMYCYSWEEIDGDTYSFDENGYMVNGWKQVGTNWYYFNESGHMLKNQWLGDYYFGSDGVMATNTWIGNYYVGADGKWIRDYQ